MTRKLQTEMENVEPWLKAIAEYLLDRDDLKPILEKENKSLLECGNYIMSEARKKGTRVCMTDDEVFGLAVHYYDEDDLNVEETVGKVNLVKSENNENEDSKPSSDENVDIEAIVEVRIQERLQEIERKKKEKRNKKKEKSKNVEQVSLFDL